MNSEHSQKLTEILVRACKAIGNGSACSIGSSLEFLEEIPNEIAAEINKLRSETKKRGKEIASLHKAIIRKRGIIVRQTKQFVSARKALKREIARLNTLAMTSQSQKISTLEHKLEQAIDAGQRLIKQRDEARAERDEARREVCENTASHRSRPPFRRHYREEIANERGWSYLYETEDK